MIYAHRISLSESYHVTNKSAHKWGTEKLWRDEDYFVKQHDEGANWWEGAEKTPAEKAKKVRLPLYIVFLINDDGKRLLAP